jgi:NAD(P)-dependent dehydrogenase (short-subunit alcohol dehydrogenase family)
LRHELKDTGVDVTCLLPGATETEFFRRADMLDTKVGTMKKQDAAEVAKSGFDALMDGDEKVVSGWQNKVQAFMTNSAGQHPGRNARQAGRPGHGRTIRPKSLRINPRRSHIMPAASGHTSLSGRRKVERAEYR